MIEAGSHSGGWARRSERVAVDRHKRAVRHGATVAGTGRLGPSVRPRARPWLQRLFQEELPRAFVATRRSQREV